MQGGTRGGQGSSDFGGEAQEHDAERLRPDEPDPRGMLGKPRLGGAEQPVVLHRPVAFGVQIGVEVGVILI